MPPRTRLSRLRELSIKAQASEARGERYSQELADFLVELDHETLFNLVEIAYHWEKTRNWRTPNDQ